MDREIIIFGKSSILSKNFVKHIKKRNESLIFVTRQKDTANDIECDLSKKLLPNFIREKALQIEKSSRNIDKVLILFAWSGGPRSTLLAEDNWKINSNIIINFLEICKHLAPKRILFLSSAGAIYPQNKKKFFTELDNTLPTSNYGKQKIKAENLIKNFAKLNKIEFTILRVSSAYGYDSRFSDQGVINKWLYSTIKNKNLKLYKSKSSLINFISFEQISEAILLAINYKLNGTYNIGTKNSVTLQSIINTISYITKKNPNLEIINQEVRYFNIDVRKFYKETGVLFNFNLEENIKHLYKLIKLKIQ